MPITPNTLAPMAAASDMSPSSGQRFEFPVTATGYERGDLMVFGSGSLVSAVNIGTINTAIGVAAEDPRKLGTTAAAGDPLTVSLALPGAMFYGSMVAAITTDLSATAATAASCLGVRLDTLEVTDSGVGTFCCIDHGTSAAPIVAALRFDRQYDAGQSLPEDSDRPKGHGDLVDINTSIVNPRVVFMFIDTFWSPTA